MKIKLVINAEEVKKLIGKALNTTIVGEVTYHVVEVDWNKYDTEATFILESVEPPAEVLIDDRDGIA